MVHTNPYDTLVEKISQGEREIQKKISQKDKNLLTF
jgi:hypothetical protein